MHLCPIMQFSGNSGTVIETTMKSIIAAVVLLAICAGAHCEKVSYENYRVYSIQAKTEEQLELLRAIESNRDDDLLFLSSPSTQIPTDIVVSPQTSEYIDEILAKYGLEFAIKTHNLQRFVLFNRKWFHRKSFFDISSHCFVHVSLIDEEQPKQLQATFGWTQYNKLSEIYSWLDGLLEQYPNVLTSYDFGKSYENRTLRAVKLSHKEVFVDIKYFNWYF